ncbi:hypothetical protein ACR2XN_29090, partial [Klebsiella pneumoniae]
INLKNHNSLSQLSHHLSILNLSNFQTLKHHLNPLNQWQILNKIHHLQRLHQRVVEELSTKLSGPKSKEPVKSIDLGPMGYPFRPDEDVKSLSRGVCNTPVPHRGNLGL